MAITLTDECVHGMLPAWCADCRHLPDPGMEDRVNRGRHFTGPWIPALYPGKCSRCRERFGVDGRIRADGEGGWIAADCCQGAQDE